MQMLENSKHDHMQENDVVLVRTTKKDGPMSPDPSLIDQRVGSGDETNPLWRNLCLKRTLLIIKLQVVHVHVKHNLHCTSQGGVEL